MNEFDQSIQDKSIFGVIGVVLRKLFGSIYWLASSVEKGAMSVDQVAGYAYQSSKGLEDEARIEREKRLQELTKDD